MFLVNMTFEHADKNPKREIVKSDELSCLTSPRKLFLTCLKSRGVDTLTRTAPVRPLQNVSAGQPVCVGVGVEEGHKVLV